MKHVIKLSTIFNVKKLYNLNPKIRILMLMILILRSLMKALKIISKRYYRSVICMVYAK